MPESLETQKQGLGTSAVFFTAISTILGAIMFLRFGFAVGNLGLFWSLIIILIGHLVTVPTAMAISEIATNQKVEGGGIYFIISRSFGLNIGGAIGIALYLSQAISIAFYVIAFAQAFQPLFSWVLIEHGWYFEYQTQIISIPSMILLIILVLTKGADIGLKILYVVVGILFISLILFFLGSTEYSQGAHPIPWEKPDAFESVGFFAVFAICFPGFTGMAAGVGLSGDLKSPSKSIPRGTMWATIVGGLIYVGIVIKLALSAPLESLADLKNQLIMQDIALWGPIIPIGLAAACLSSAIGSIIVAPRTLQAIGQDNILPGGASNNFFARINKKNNEPINASIATSVLAFAFVLINNVNAVAEIISIFFMITYGALCLISFFEHFAADPAYRPSFRSKWYLSLTGAVFCFVFMFQMKPFYALAGVIFMVLIFLGISFGKGDKAGMSVIFQGVISQASRRLQVFLQKVQKDQTNNWRPSVISISERSFDRFGAFEILRWTSRKYGFGTYIHMIHGYLSKDTVVESQESLDRLIKMADTTNSNIYLDTIVSPSFTSAVAQTLQLPGISGKDNNMILLEFEKGKPEELKDFMNNFNLIKSTGFDVCLLASSIRNFGFKRSLHIWITPTDFSNANLMILMGYIILGHPEWSKGEIKIFVIHPVDEQKGQREKLLELIDQGRLPISSHNILMIPKMEGQDDRDIINEYSKDADLTFIGFRSEILKHNGLDIFNGYDGVGDVLFMNTEKEKEIK